MLRGSQRSTFLPGSVGRRVVPLCKGLLSMANLPYRVIHPNCVTSSRLANRKGFDCRMPHVVSLEPGLTLSVIRKHFQNARSSFSVIGLGIFLPVP